MANQEHLDILNQGVEVWNKWRKEHADIRPDLFRANLIGADLSRAILRDADLRSADLIKANLSGADLNGAYLSYANLSNAYLSNADLSGADLNGALLNGTLFENVDLRSVKGLVEVDHMGPSIVQLHTVQLPQDGSAIHFLRGTGLPDEWLDFYRATMMSPIVYHSVFISYSSKNEDFAKRLHSDLQDNGVRCWFAPHDLRPGTVIVRGIDEAIHVHDKLLLILSEESVASNWVEHEVDIALFKEMKRKQQDVLFPIRLDNAVLESPSDWARNLCHRHIGDFTHWKQHDEYQEAFKRLLHDLKAEGR